MVRRRPDTIQRATVCNASERPGQEPRRAEAFKAVLFFFVVASCLSSRGNVTACPFDPILVCSQSSLSGRSVHVSGCVSEKPVMPASPVR